jgi:hypothetical protein
MTTLITKENLPPTPTEDNLSTPSFNALPPPPPPPPLKSPQYDTPPHSNGHLPLPVDNTSSNQGTFTPSHLFFHCTLRLDLNDQPGTPTSPPSPDPRGKRPNLLVDLIETEKLYVDQMAGIIRVRRLHCQFSGRHCSYDRSLYRIESGLSMVSHKPPSPRIRSHV